MRHISKFEQNIGLGFEMEFEAFWMKYSTSIKKQCHNLSQISKTKIVSKHLTHLDVVCSSTNNKNHHKYLPSVANASCSEISEMFFKSLYHCMQNL